MRATFELNGNLFMCSDSPPVHEWNFSPAVSTLNAKTKRNLKKYSQSYQKMERLRCH